MDVRVGDVFRLASARSEETALCVVVSLKTTLQAAGNAGLTLELMPLAQWEAEHGPTGITEESAYALPH